jgi:hypothetical protein
MFQSMLILPLNVSWTLSHAPGLVRLFAIEIVHITVDVSLSSQHLNWCFITKRFVVNYWSLILYTICELKKNVLQQTEIQLLAFPVGRNSSVLSTVWVIIYSLMNSEAKVTIEILRFSICRFNWNDKLHKIFDGALDVITNSKQDRRDSVTWLAWLDCFFMICSAKFVTRSFFRPLWISWRSGTTARQNTKPTHETVTP